MRRGDVDAGLAAADVVHDATYTTAENTNNPLGLFATVAAWDGDTVVCTTPRSSPPTSAPWSPRRSGSRRPRSGCSRRTWAAASAPGCGVGSTSSSPRSRHGSLGRPVKVVLTRPQMFTGVGHRPHTVQRIRLGATRDGELVAIDHEATPTVAMEDDNATSSRHRFAAVATRARTCPRGTGSGA